MFVNPSCNVSLHEFGSTLILVRRVVHVGVNPHSVELSEAGFFLSFQCEVGIVGGLALVKVNLLHNSSSFTLTLQLMSITIGAAS